MIRRHVDFVRGEQFAVALGIFEQVFHHFDEFVRLLGRHTVEAEAGGLLALPHEVEEEVVQDVAPAVELQEVLSVFHFRRHTLGCSVTAEAGDDTDFSRLLVADEQDVLFFCFLCHFYLRLFCCLFIDCLFIYLFIQSFIISPYHILNCSIVSGSFLPDGFIYFSIKSCTSWSL